MKPQLEKKEKTKEEIERKKMGMRGQTNQIWCYQPAEVLKKIRSPSEIVHLLGESIL